jgi:hypothetical protein
MTDESVSERRRKSAVSAAVKLSKAELRGPRGPWRRYGKILLVLLLLAAVGPYANRFVSSYRAVVLAVSGDQMFIMPRLGPPRWVAAIPIHPGDVIEKPAFHWQPEPRAATPEDKPTLAVYGRYVSAYEGTIIKVGPPRQPNAVATVTLETAAGEPTQVQLWSQPPWQLQVGQQMRKLSGTWDPVFLPAPNESR